MVEQTNVVAYRLEVYGGQTSKSLTDFNRHIDILIREGWQPYGQPAARPGYGHMTDANAMGSQIYQAFVRYRAFADQKDQT